MQGIKLYFWNLDLWPESVTETTGFNVSLIIKGLEKIVRFIYRNSDKILISSRAFEQSVVSKGVDESRIIYFPNWAEDVFLKNEFTPVHLTDYKIASDSLNIMFAGNIGAAQDMEGVMSAIEIASKGDNPISWLFF